MATGKSNERGTPNRPPADDSLWTDDPPLASRKGTPAPGAASASAAAGKPVKPAREATPTQKRRPAVSSGVDLAALVQTVPSVTNVAPGDSEEDENSLDILLGLAQNAPAWLISAVVHTSLLIILGLCLAVGNQKTVLINEGINLSEPMGESLDESALSDVGPGQQLIEKNDSQVLTPKNLPQVDNPFATPPDLADMRLGPGGIMPAPSNLHSPVIGLSLHGREGGMKGALLGIYGGNAATESAVGRGLEWLVKQQRPDGLWSLSGPYADHSMQENQPAATAMALLAFQGAGITHTKGKYSKNVDKGWTALLKLQARDGSFIANTPPHQGLYAHAQCTIALCEILSLTRDNRFYEPAQRAVDFCVAAQDKKEGGWRYDYPPHDSDTSVTGWYVMALKSAQMAGLSVPDQTLYDITRFLDTVAEQNGRYAYMARSFDTPAVTAEAYLCRQLLGWKQDDPRLLDGCKIILSVLPRYTPGEPRDVYYWYYATQVCHHMEGEIWNTWNEVMREQVPAHQVTDGPEYGSWSPEGDRWGTVGRLYTTCLSIYMLEVYYRHLPIYSAYKYTGQ